MPPLRLAAAAAAAFSPHPMRLSHRRSADRTRVYVASEEERAADAVEARKAALLAAGIVLGPVLMMGAMVLGK